jgi:hypothetical protein
MPHNDEFPSPMMDIVLGYKHQHQQESYVIAFFYEQNNLSKGPIVHGHSRWRTQLE